MELFDLFADLKAYEFELNSMIDGEHPISTIITKALMTSKEPPMTTEVKTAAQQLYSDANVKYFNCGVIGNYNSECKKPKRDEKKKDNENELKVLMAADSKAMWMQSNSDDSSSNDSDDVEISLLRSSVCKSGLEFDSNDSDKSYKKLNLATNKIKPISFVKGSLTDNGTNQSCEDLTLKDEITYFLPTLGWLKPRKVAANKSGISKPCKKSSSFKQKSSSKVKGSATNRKTCIHNSISFHPVLMELLNFFIFILSFIWCTKHVLKKFTRNAQKKQSLSLPPGPMGLPIFGNLPFLNPEVHSYFTDLAKTYGPIFSLRLGNKIAVVISNSSVAQEVLKEQDIIFANRDVPIAGNVGLYGGSDILWSPYGPEWRMLRKVCFQEMLSRTKVDSFYHIRRREVRKIVNSLWVRRMSQVDVGEEMFTAVLNSISTILWGECGNEILERNLGTEFHLFVEEFLRLLGVPNISDFIPSLAYFDLQGIEKNMKRLVKRLDNVFELMINERMREDDNNKKDFLQSLLNLRKGGGPLNTIHLKSLLMDMIIAGTGTTSNMIEFTLAEMMNDPKIMKKAQQELEVVVGTNNIVDESHIHKLPYLYAVMKETLRLHPAAPLLAPHLPSESCTIGGYTILKGTRVFINVWAIHRDPSFWENPLKFDPQRFMNSKYDYSGNDFNYLPFGSGRRICVGIEIAERMFLYLLASLLHSFEWKESDGEKIDLKEKFGFVIKKKKPLMAIPTPRLLGQALYE
ncbi:flavonoid 3'-monooxygenase-like [Impatiens glandulifera]|uniref:flavonoid 3'-monooxygenase-like n=1 Tax=Impatiens glandulifera TaxID=253017 RepID=UPI001FB0725E|nr:flavonoid 3'-monooxygenase-like [Impatiens glandulifera]